MVAALLGAFFAIHDVPRWLSAPYWLDEAWVAVSTRVALSDLPTVTASTPIGFTLALRLVPGPDLLRLIPLGFHLAAVVLAYVLGRLTIRHSHTTAVLGGTAAASAVLLLPAQQLRHDLKQYSADAAICVLFLVLAAWTEAEWSRRRLGIAAAAVPIGLLFSHTTAIVGAAMFGALILVPATRRRWDRCLEALGAALVAAAGLALVYWGVSRRGRTTKLDAYWADNYPSLTGLPSYVVHHVGDLGPLVGAPAPVAVTAAALGLIVIGRARRPVLAVTLILLPVVMAGLGVARIYPLLDPRLDHFALVGFAAVAGIGLAGTAVEVTRFAVARRRFLAVAVGVVAIALGGYATANQDWYRFDGTTPPGGIAYPAGSEDVRAQVEYVQARLRPGDVVLVNDNAVFGVAFYWSHSRIDVSPFSNAIGFVPEVPQVVVASAGTRPAVDAALGQAVDRARAAGGRVWIISTHDQAEQAVWRTALAPFDVSQTTDLVEPVRLITRP